MRLLHGDMSRVTVYGADPSATARRFAEEGATIIHIVDLDGAIAGEPRNLDAIVRIRAEVGCALDVSGGLRTIETIREVIAAGADRVSIGSAAFLSPDLIAQACAEFPGRVFGSLDVRDGRLAIKGWIETSPMPVAKAAELFREVGVAAAVVTDIARDGAQTGIDAQRMAEIAKGSRLPVIASGGVSTLDDIRRRAARIDDGVVGVVVGRALYEGNFSLREAILASRL